VEQYCHFRNKKGRFCLKEIKFGGVVSKAKILDIQGLNHRVDYAYGYKEEYIKQLISTFFKSKRNNK